MSITYINYKIKKKDVRHEKRSVFRRSLLKFSATKVRINKKEPEAKSEDLFTYVEKDAGIVRNNEKCRVFLIP